MANIAQTEFEKEKQISTVIEELEKAQVDVPTYSEIEKHFIMGLQRRLVWARNYRDQEHPEFDNMSFLQYYDENEKWANSYIMPKKNKEDTNFTSGIVRQKLLALLAIVNNLDLSPDISAFSSDEIKIQAVGDAMEDIFLKAEDLDGDEEKKLIRQYELLKHGTVFVEEIWDERYIKDKKGPEFDGKNLNATWTSRMKKLFARPSRNVIPATNVFLGDITQYEVAKQPYIYTVEIKHYDEAKSIYGQWERWQYVTRDLKKFSPATEYGMLINSWRLTQVLKDHVEIIKYQDKWNNEYAVICNGVLMTPVGMPMPWGWDEYNITQQNLEPIHSKFAYGNSFVRKVRANAALFDEMMRLAVLKTQKSFMPPYLNISGRIVSNRIFMPGKITHGIMPGTIVPVSDKESRGVEQGELVMIQEISKAIDNQSISPIGTGQSTERKETATAIIEMQRQAKLILGNIVFASSMLEWKLSWLRLYDIVKNWFDDKANDARNVLQSVNVERMIPGEGVGRRITIPIKGQLPSSLAVAKTEATLQQESGQPTRVIFLNPDEIKSAKLTWQIVIRPRERVTSETQTLLFRAFMQDAMVFGPLLNMEELGQEFASVWGKNSAKLFNKPQASQMAGQAPGGAGQPPTPGANLPTPQKAAGQQMTAALGMAQ